MRWTDYQDFEFTTAEGKEYGCRYRTSKGKFPMVEVSYGDSSKSAVLHASPAEVLARLLALELAAEQEARNRR